MSPSPTILNDLVKVIDKLVKSTKKNLKSKPMTNARDSMGCEEFSCQMCSIRIGLPRRSGNTTLALKLLKKYPESIYVGTTLSQTKEAGSVYKGKISDSKRFISINKLDIGRGIVEKAPLIVITDCLGYASKEAVTHMFQSLRSMNPIYIHVG